VWDKDGKNKKPNKKINHAARDAPYVSLKKRIAVQTPFMTRSRLKVCRNTIWGRT